MRECARGNAADLATARPRGAVSSNALFAALRSVGECNSCIMTLGSPLRTRLSMSGPRTHHRTPRNSVAVICSVADKARDSDNARTPRWNGKRAGHLPLVRALSVVRRTPRFTSDGATILPTRRRLVQALVRRHPLTHSLRSWRRLKLTQERFGLKDATTAELSLHLRALVSRHLMVASEEDIAPVATGIRG